jgi:hypothetical protein
MDQTNLPFEHENFPLLITEKKIQEIIGNQKGRTV